MAFEPRSQRSGIAWFILLLLPPLVILVALIALFVWQGKKGGIQPKWRKPPAEVTNTISGSPSPTERP
jgi:flagellar basal body-associated protein FliL